MDLRILILFALLFGATITQAEDDIFRGIWKSECREDEMLPTNEEVLIGEPTIRSSKQTILITPRQEFYLESRSFSTLDCTGEPTYRIPLKKLNIYSASIEGNRLTVFIVGDQKLHRGRKFLAGKFQFVVMGNKAESEIIETQHEIDGKFVRKIPKNLKEKSIRKFKRHTLGFAGND